MPSKVNNSAVRKRVWSLGLISVIFLCSYAFIVFMTEDEIELTDANERPFEEPVKTKSAPNIGGTSHGAITNWTVSGSVTDKTSGLPISSISVVVVVARQEHSATTSKSGNFQTPQFRSDGREIVQIRISAPGYFALSIDSCVEECEDIAIQLTPAPPRRTIEIRLGVGSSPMTPAEKSKECVLVLHHMKNAESPHDEAKRDIRVLLPTDFPFIVDVPDEWCSVYVECCGFTRGQSEPIKVPEVKVGPSKIVTLPLQRGGEVFGWVVGVNEADIASLLVSARYKGFQFVPRTVSSLSGWGSSGLSLKLASKQQLAENESSPPFAFRLRGLRTGQFKVVAVENSGAAVSDTKTVQVEPNSVNGPIILTAPNRTRVTLELNGELAKFAEHVYLLERESPSGKGKTQRKTYKAKVVDGKATLSAVALGKYQVVVLPRQRIDFQIIDLPSVVNSQFMGLVKSVFRAAWLAEDIEVLQLDPIYRKHDLDQSILEFERWRKTIGVSRLRESIRRSRDLSELNILQREDTVKFSTLKSEEIIEAFFELEKSLMSFEEKDLTYLNDEVASRLKDPTKEKFIEFLGEIKSCIAKKPLSKTLERVYGQENRAHPGKRK